MDMLNDKPNILILDSGRKGRGDALKHLLSSHYSVLISSSLKETLIYLESQFTHYAVILLMIRSETDLNMVAPIKTASCFSEIIVVADSARASLAIQSLKQGVLDYVTEPVEPELLLKSVENGVKSAFRFKKVHDYFLTQIRTSEPFQERFNHLMATIQAKRLQGQYASVDELAGVLEGSAEEVKKGLKEVQSQFHLGDAMPRKPAILLVEDDLEIAASYVRLLKTRYIVFHVTTGEDALKTLRLHPEIAAILTDIYLPDEFGYTLIPKLKQLNPMAEIAMITAFGDQLDIALASLRAGATDYLTKPIDNTDLYTTLANLVQSQYFNRLMPHISDGLLYELPYSSKIHRLEEEAARRHEEGRELTMQDIYLYFPELRRDLPLPETTEFPYRFTQDMAELMEGLMSRAQTMR